MRKKIALFVINTCALFVVGIYIFSGYVFKGWPLNPFKETSPLSPGFDRAQFQFEDYQDGHKLLAALRIILPVGTSMEEVDKVLVDTGGAIKTFVGSATKRPDYRYCHVAWYSGYRAMYYISDTWADDVFITYDDQKKLKKIRVGFSRASKCQQWGNPSG